METTELKKTKIAGKSNLKFTDNTIFEIGDVENHRLSLRKAEGINDSRGETGFMDGARVINISFSDVINFNGPHQGYVIMEKDGIKIISKWEGIIRTDISNEGKPVPTFKGTMEWIKTAGKYENMKGEFKYDGYFTSESEYTVVWEGEYFPL